MTTTQVTTGTIDELAGQQCDELIGICERSTPTSPMFAMLRAGDRWFRLSIDVGVLFFEPSDDPFDSEEVGEDDIVIDLLQRGGPAMVKRMGFQDGMLDIELVERGIVRIVEDVQTSTLMVSFDK